MRIIFVAGGFDPIHAGHVEMIQLARGLGDYLIVSVARRKHMIKKKGYEFMPEAERVEILRNIKGVDEVQLHIGEDGTVIENLKALRKRYRGNTIIFAKGGDRYKDEIPEKEICKELSIEIVDRLGKKNKVVLG
ncbi:MAG: adenylyltransferase/cytidyltransferase family protein [Peptococcaceae bacterium]|nr:adenylyltransferase/cytidyltransferase family protein [Peptococcaceae bacterium]